MFSSRGEAPVLGPPALLVAHHIGVGKPGADQRRVDAARGDGGNHPGRIPDEQRASRRRRMHEAAARDQARANRLRLLGPEVDQRSDLVEKRRHHRLGAGPIAALAAREPDLDDVHARHDPADVARRETAIDEAMELVRVVELDAGILVLDTEEEASVLAEPQRLRHARLRTVRADDVACRVGAVDLESAAGAFHVSKRLAQL